MQSAEVGEGLAPPVSEEVGDGANVCQRQTC